MALKVELKPFEQIIIGQSVITKLGYANDAHDRGARSDPA